MCKEVLEDLDEVVYPAFKGEGMDDIPRPTDRLLAVKASTSDSSRNAVTAAFRNKGIFLITKMPKLAYRQRKFIFRNEQVVH